MGKHFERQKIVGAFILLEIILFFLHQTIMLSKFLMTKKLLSWKPSVFLSTDIKISL